jgi:hypothetical protein
MSVIAAQNPMFFLEILALQIAQQDNTLTTECEYLEEATVCCATLLDELIVTRPSSSKMDSVKQIAGQGILATIKSDTLVMHIEMYELEN